MFHDATNFGIEGSHFVNVQGNVNITNPMIPLEAPGKVKRVITPAPEPAIFSDSNHYCSQLLYRGRGYPMYIPGPQANLPPEYKRTGISIGDVGSVAQEGDFDFFFNIFLPASDPINVNAPADFEPLPPYNPMDVAHYDSSPGNVVASPSIHETIGDFSESAPGGYFRFSCQGPDGAVLALPYGAHLEKLRSLQLLRQYAAKNAESWYRYANEIRGRGLENGSLYLVTGTEKARSWGMASFHDVPFQDEFPLSFEPTARADGGYRYRWRGTRFQHKHRDADLPAGNDTPLNQTTFIYAFAISLCEGLWGFRKSAEICQVTGPPTTSKWGGRAHVPFGLPSRASWWSFSAFDAVVPNGGMGHSACVPCQDGLHWDATPVLKLIHEHILHQLPEARVIITHDDDWCEVFRDDGHRMTAAGLQQAIFSCSEIVEEDGVVFLRTKESKPGESDPETPDLDSRDEPWLPDIPAAASEHKLRQTKPISVEDRDPSDSLVDRSQDEVHKNSRFPTPDSSMVPDSPVPPQGCASTKPTSRAVAPLPPWDIFPIDLTNAINFHHLARTAEDYVIPAQTPIYIRPTTGGPYYFFKLNTGPSARSAFFILHDLQTLIGAPLSLHDFRTGLNLKLSAQRAVRQYFVDRNRSGAASVWRSFLKGRDLVNGPVGADLLRGRIFIWGFAQDYEGNWTIHVDRPGGGVHGASDAPHGPAVTHQTETQLESSWRQSLDDMEPPAGLDVSPNWVPEFPVNGSSQSKLLVPRLRRHNQNGSVRR
ncbi:hypothetical protein FB45DRAFT_872116 [Roridomyces roridus]|uniref:Uncharacterized protein n=1 Tax=Roridomyces roridus TaxID=1738132 RepID=A0AAD7FE92_9AGAR|nr:hypothetical protein FB45DRAFT_872116 [Roridomyces roridus]